MSDYLSRLVKRSHNSAEVIKPRLASLFEPPVQDGVSFRGKYGSDHLNVDPISNEREHNDLLPTRPSSDPASGNGELKELHQQNHKPHVRSGAFQQTEQPEPQHIPDPQRIDRIHSILNHDIGRFSDQLAPQPSKQDHTVQLSSDNKTYKPYKTHDMPHRTSDMKSQPYAHDPDIRSNEISPSAPVLPQSNQEPPEQVQALSSINNKNHDVPHRTGDMKSQPYAHDPDIRSNEISPSAPVLPQSDQEPPEQVQALSSINNKNHDIPHRTGDMKSQPYAHDPDIRSNEISPSASVLPQSNQEPPEQVKALSSINNMNHDMPHRTGDMKSQPYAHDPDIRSNEISPSAPVLPQSNQEPPEQVQALSSINNKNHDVPHRTGDMKSQPYAHDPDIRSNEISPSAPVLPQSDQEPPEQVQALSSINNMNHDMPHRSGTKRSRMSAQSQEIQPFVIKPAVSHEKMQITKPAEPIEPPVIKVTIGRIEVRAVTPPAPIPPQQVKQSSPVLSLDEYLRLRNGGAL